MDVKADEILGVDFLESEDAIVSFHYNTLVTKSNPVSPIQFSNFPDKLSEMTKMKRLPRRHVLQARTRKIIEIEVENDNSPDKYGYLPRIKTLENVFIGEAIVRKMGSTFSCLAINATSEDVEIEVGPQQL